MNEQKDKIFILWAPEEWGGYVQRPHWIGLGQKSNMLVLEPPVGLSVFWLHPERIKSIFKTGRGIRKGEHDIYFYRPLSLFTYGICYKFPFLARLDKYFMKFWLKRLTKILRKDFPTLIVILTKNQQYYIADLIPGDLICYQITDEYYCSPQHDMIDIESNFYRKAYRSEKKIMNFVDVVIVSSRNLYHSRKSVFKNIIYIPNTADYHHFSKAQDPYFDIPDELSKIPGVKIGFVGNFNELISLDLLISLAKHDENWSLILIGSENGKKKYKNTPKYLELKTLDNVYFLGRKPYRELPGYLKGLDVCMLPFRSCPWMDGSFPNKIIQYLASGKPVISTDFQSAREFGSVIDISRDAEDFISKIKMILDSDSKQQKSERIDVAKLYSIGPHADLYISYIHDLLEKSRT
jgi:glycosyltransferase involved in cell wall biosynthesis